MSKGEDFFQIISDFIKGKSGPPDANMATVSFDEDFDPNNLILPKLSRTFKDFGVEYPAVSKALSKCRFHHCLAILGGMTTLPKLQSNAFRLDVLIHLAFIYARGNTRPRPAQITAWFNQLDKGSCGRQEDAAEDVFLTNVIFEGETYRLFEGTAEGNRFYTQIFLTILEGMPREGSYQFLRDGVRSVLRLSEAIADRAQLPSYCVGEIVPRSHLGKPDDAVLSELRTRVQFSHEQIAEMGINLGALRPFMIEQDTFKNLGEFSSGHTPLEAMPITPAEHGLIVYLPSCIGIAIRHLLISQCFKAGMGDQLQEALVRAYVSHFANEGVLKSSPPPLKIQCVAGQSIAQLIKEIDTGRYVHFLFIVDNFEGFEEGSFMTMNSVDTVSDLVRRCIEHAHEIHSEKAGFREGLTIIVPCGWGRGFGVVLPENPPNWRCNMIVVHDLLTLHHTPSFRDIDLFKILDAKDAFEALGFSLFNPNGFLNLYGWVNQNDGHIIRHEDFRNEEQGDSIGLITIPMTCALKPRFDAYMGADIKAIRKSDGTVARLRRMHGSPRYGTETLSPFYAEIGAFYSHRFCSVYIGQRNHYWFEVSTDQNLDPDIQYQILNMATQWAEFVFKYLDELPELPAGKVVTCAVHFEDTTLPDGNDAIPTADVIASLFVRNEKDNSEGNRIAFTVREGFLASTRRVDNLAERKLVKFLLVAYLEMLGTIPEDRLLEGMVQTVVKSDKARHFHAFSVPKPRDFIRDDLPPEPEVITRFDDATTRLGLGWLVQDRSAPHRIEGFKDCTAFLRGLVRKLSKRFKHDVSQYERGAIVDLCLRNHEAASKEIDMWKRTFGAVEALSDVTSLAAQKATEQLSQMNAACMASRIIVEAAICECSIEQGIVPGKHDIGPLMAYASLIHHLGGYSDAIRAGVMPAKIEISAAGEVMMDHGFSDDVIRPFGETFQASSLANAKAKYSEHYLSEGGAADSSDDQADTLEPEVPDPNALSHDAKFAEAWRNEYGFSVENMQAFFGGFFDILEADRKAVISLSRSKLMARLAKDTALEAEIIQMCLDAFTYFPRDAWDVPPEGCGEWAWAPWKFQRPLSIVTRPIIQFNTLDDPTYIIAPAMVVSHLSSFMAGARSGGLDRRLFRENGPLSKWTDSINGEMGEAFNIQVASRFREIGWHAEANLSDGQILNRKRSQTFGDVDVLAWNESEKRVLVIECKDLSLEKTIGEIAKRLSKYQGVLKPNGKPDDLKKHLNRCEEIETQRDKVGEFVNMGINQIDRVLLFSEPTPLQYTEITERHGVELVTFKEIGDRFALTQT